MSLSIRKTLARSACALSCVFIFISAKAQGQSASDAAVIRLGHAYGAVTESIEDCRYRPDQVPKSQVEQFVQGLSSQQERLFHEAALDESTGAIIAPAETARVCQAQLRELDAALAAVRR